MSQLLAVSFKQARALICTCHSVAIPTTLVRLGHRIHSRKLWWDDFWATMALGSDIILFVVFLSTISGGGLEKTSEKKSATFLQASRWLTLLSYTMTLWAARLTVAVTVVRILPQGRMRRVAKGASITFGLFAMAMVFQKVIACTRKSSRIAYCATISKYSVYTGIMELVTDCIADTWLLCAPAYILWRIKLQSAQRNLILTIFLCGIFTSFASIAHVVFILVNSPVWLRLTGHIEVSVAIIVSNLLVVVTYAYRVFRQLNANADASRQAEAPNPLDASDAETAMTTTGQLNSGEPSFSSDASSSKVTVQTTTVELTELSYLGTSLDITTQNNQSYNRTTGTIGSSPFSSFSYPTNPTQVSSRA